MWPPAGHPVFDHPIPWFSLILPLIHFLNIFPNGDKHLPPFPLWSSLIWSIPNWTFYNLTGESFPPVATVLPTPHLYGYNRPSFPCDPRDPAVCSGWLPHSSKGPHGNFSPFFLSYFLLLHPSVQDIPVAAHVSGKDLLTPFISFHFNVPNWGDFPPLHATNPWTTLFFTSSFKLFVPPRPMSFFWYFFGVPFQIYFRRQVGLEPPKPRPFNLTLSSSPPP